MPKSGLRSPGCFPKLLCLLCLEHLSYCTEIACPACVPSTMMNTWRDTSVLKNNNTLHSAPESTLRVSQHLKHLARWVHVLIILYFSRCLLCIYARVCVCVLSRFSQVWLFATPWTVACQTPLSTGLPRQEYWSGLLCPPPEDLPHLGMEPTSPVFFALTGGFFTTSTTWGRRQWHPTPVLLPGKSHGRRSLVGCSPWGREESNTTERLHFHFSLSCIGEGNGNPLQCSCLENPRDGGAWWAAV